jgi:hypothetical protein
MSTNNSLGGFPLCHPHHTTQMRKKKFERNWTFYKMIEDYYRESPDPIIRILKEKDDEGNED